MAKPVKRIEKKKVDTATKGATMGASSEETRVKNMITSKRIVHHVFQNTIEYWEHCSLRGWIPVNKFEAGDWLRGTFEYVELIHHMEPDINGMFGPLIKM